jgi:hypothetical protein
MSRNILVAVWGGKSAGKTAFSAALTRQLTKYFMAVLLSSADKFMPAFAAWGIVPDKEKAKKEGRVIESLGEMQKCPNLTGEYIKKRLISHPDNNRIMLSGYFAGEDCELYNDIDGNTAQSLLNEFRKIAQVSVIDCTIPKTDMLSEKALQCADVVIILLEPNAAGIGFVGAQNSFIRRNLSDGRRYVFLASKVSPDSAVAQFEYQLGIRFFKNRIPYTYETTRKLNRLELFKPYDGEYADTVDAVAAIIKGESEI